MSEEKTGEEFEFTDQELQTIISEPSEGTVEAEMEGDALEVEEPEPDDPSVAYQTTRVRLYDVSCSGGASTSLLVPVTAFGYHARLGYFRRNGSRIGLSPIWDRPGSVYAGVTLRVRFNGRIPAGTKDLRAFWWYGSAGDGPVYWNRVATDC